MVVSVLVLRQDVVIQQVFEVEKSLGVSGVKNRLR
jgi:hypothetical protein